MDDVSLDSLADVLDRLRDPRLGYWAVMAEDGHNVVHRRGAPCVPSALFSMDALGQGAFPQAVDYLRAWEWAHDQGEVMDLPDDLGGRLVIPPSAWCPACCPREHAEESQ